MKSLIRILVVATFVLVIGISFNLSFSRDRVLIDNKKEIVENEKLDIEKEKTKNVENTRPKKGISTFIGKSVHDFQEKYGKPSRQEPSYYGYTWWIYNKEENYIMVGVLNNKVVTIAVGTPNIDISPFKIGETLESVYKKVNMESEIEIKNKDGVYRFELFEDDVNIKPLIPLGEIYAQLYFDHFEGKLLFIRFMDDEILLKHRPYDLTYRGKLVEHEPLTDEEWASADAATEKQIYELTNLVRKNYNLSELVWDEDTRTVAYEHSQNMFDTETFSHDSEKYGDLADRLNNKKIYYETAGENIAYQYTDSLAVVSGWLNSKGHRETLLDRDFTHIGVGVYRKYYTQNFLEKSWEE